MRIKVVLGLIALLVSFAFGRYSSVLTTTATNDTKVKVQDDSTTQTHTITVILKRPDGSSTTTETTDTTAKSKVTENKEDISKTAVQTQKKSQTNISLLATNYLSHDQAPRYGVSIQRELLGPMTAGVFGLNNGVVGFSVGLNF